MTIIILTKIPLSNSTAYKHNCYPVFICLNYSQVYKGRLVDALAIRGEEGRGRLRKATGSCQHTLIRRYPNGETHLL